MKAYMSSIKKAAPGSHSPAHSEASDDDEKESIPAVPLKITPSPSSVMAASIPSLPLPSTQIKSNTKVKTSPRSSSIKTKRESMTINKDGSEIGLVFDNPPDYLGFSEKLATAAKVLVSNSRDEKKRKSIAMLPGNNKVKSSYQKKSSNLLRNKVSLNESRLNKTDLFKPVIVTNASDQLRKSSQEIASVLTFLKKEHVSTLKAIFAVLDEDQDGLLNDEQLYTAILCTGLNPGHSLMEEIKSSVPIWIRGGVDLNTVRDISYIYFPNGFFILKGFNFFPFLFFFSFTS